MPTLLKAFRLTLVGAKLERWVRERNPEKEFEHKTFLSGGVDLVVR
jgi:hypothetical protein